MDSIPTLDRVTSLRFLAMTRDLRSPGDQKLIQIDGESDVSLGLERPMDDGWIFNMATSTRGRRLYILVTAQRQVAPLIYRNDFTKMSISALRISQDRSHLVEIATDWIAEICTEATGED